MTRPAWSTCQIVRAVSSPHRSSCRRRCWPSAHPARRAGHRPAPGRACRCRCRTGSRPGRPTAPTPPRRKPFPDLLQLLGEFRLGRALPVPPLPVLGEHRPPRLPAGETSIPKSSSITGRSGCRTDSRASPLTRGPFGGRPGFRGPAGGRGPRPEAGGRRPEAGCVTFVMILVRASVRHRRSLSSCVLAGERAGNRVRTGLPR
jgi:hypothetical protein